MLNIEGKKNFIISAGGFDIRNRENCRVSGFWFWLPQRAALLSGFHLSSDT
jgi:hypothetical protein